jgi:pantothenate kinase
MVAAAVTHPFDVLKTRQQVAGWEGRTTAIGVSGSVGAATATTVAAPAAAAARKARLTLVGIYQSEGVLALYRGLSMRLATVIPASAIMVTIYETIKRWDL